jgi:hypothetical protein
MTPGEALAKMMSAKTEEERIEAKKEFEKAKQMWAKGLEKEGIVVEFTNNE